jgi:hypothetical protein
MFIGLRCRRYGDPRTLYDENLSREDLSRERGVLACQLNATATAHIVSLALREQPDQLSEWQVAGPAAATRYG